MILSTVDLGHHRSMAEVEIGSASPGVGRTGSTTSPSSRAGAPATLKTSTSPGRSTPSASSCRCWRRPWTASCAGDGHRDRTARRSRRAQPRGPVDPLRRPRLGARGDRRARRRQGDPADAGDLQRADQARAGRASGSARSVTPGWSRLPRSRPSAPALRRPSSPAELDLLVIQGTVVSAEHVSKTVEPLNLKRFIRQLEMPVIVGGCASYQAALHLMRTGAVGRPRGRRARPRLHHPRRPRHRCSAGDRHRRRPGGPHAPPRRDRRLRARHRRRRDGHRWRRRQGHRLRRRRGDDRLAARGRRRGSGPRLPLGHGDLPPDAARGARGAHAGAGARSRRSSSARPTRTTAA